MYAKAMNKMWIKMICKNINTKFADMERNFENKFTPILFNRSLTLWRLEYPLKVENGRKICTDGSECLLRLMRCYSMNNAYKVQKSAV